MVRKQLYISEEHERALKARARDHGVWEAKLVRRILDDLARRRRGEGLVGAHAKEALEGFLEGAERSSASHRFPGGYAVDRDEAYVDHT